jgi:hypothetical protein
MTGLEALQSVQYVTVGEKRFALVNVDDWEAMLEWLETSEDIQAARQALDELKAFDNDRSKAGWLRWDEIKGELE